MDGLEQINGNGKLRICVFKEKGNESIVEAMLDKIINKFSVAIEAVYPICRTLVFRNKRLLKEIKITIKNDTKFNL